MTIVATILFVIGVLLAVGGALAILQLRKWEHQLQGVRIAIAFKGKRKMTPRLIDWLKWANSIEDDKAVLGQVVYKMGGTTIALVKAPAPDANKSTTRTIKEAA